MNIAGYLSKNPNVSFVPSNISGNLLNLVVWLNWTQLLYFLNINTKNKESSVLFGQSLESVIVYKYFLECS